MTSDNNSPWQFLKTTGAAAFGVFASAQWVTAEELTPGSKLKLRFIVASDLHYGQGNTPYDKMATELVGWVNAEDEAELNRHTLSKSTN